MIIYNIDQITALFCSQSLPSHVSVTPPIRTFAFVQFFPHNCVPPPWAGSSFPSGLHGCCEKQSMKLLFSYLKRVIFFIAFCFRFDYDGFDLDLSCLVFTELLESINLSFTEFGKFSINIPSKNNFFYTNIFLLSPVIQITSTLDLFMLSHRS